MAEKRKMRTSEEMFPIIEQWQKSGMSKESFAKKHGICHGTFHHWCSRYREKEASSAPPSREVVRVAKPAFVPMEIVEEKSVPVSSVVIVLPSGIRIEVS